MHLVYVAQSQRSEDIVRSSLHCIGAGKSEQVRSIQDRCSTFHRNMHTNYLQRINITKKNMIEVQNVAHH
jgi:hypothetical protein